MFKGAFRYTAWASPDLQHRTAQLYASISESQQLFALVELKIELYDDTHSDSRTYHSEDRN